MMVPPMFMTVHILRLFLTAVTPTAGNLEKKVFSPQYFRHLGIVKMMIPVHLYTCVRVNLSSCVFVHFCACLLA